MFMRAVSMSHGDLSSLEMVSRNNLHSDCQGHLPLAPGREDAPQGGGLAVSPARGHSRKCVGCGEEMV